MTVQATFCATLVDEWARRGVAHAVVAPGSRSTPMALALAARDDVTLHVFHDERAAAFCALGVGVGGVPAILLCTSGTAAVNFHPAVVEAASSAVPMLVLTADRPPELRDVGASQTIVQTNLYGGSARWFHDPGVPDDAASTSWRSLARRALAIACGRESGEAGPVHLNLPFREPLVGTPGDLPSPLAGSGPSEKPSPRSGSIDIAHEPPPAAVVELLDRQRGVIVAGGRAGVANDDVAALAAASGWPVLADPCSGVRSLDQAVTAFDSLLRHPGFAADHRPDVVVRVGRPPASRVLAEWIAAAGPTVVQVGGPGVIDPGLDVALRLPPDALGAVSSQLRGASGTPWMARWRHGDQRAEQAITDELARSSELTEPGVARAVADGLPDDAELVVASSMPVRDLEWYGGRRARAHANRGANGIDGTMSTSIGIALATGRAVVVVLGDLAFLHDAGALTALARRGTDLRIVVVDNDGGGIFSFLPQASGLDQQTFELLFGTPHGSDITAVAAAHGLDATTVTTADALVNRIAGCGPSLTRVVTTRAANVAAHAALHDAVAAALR
ncbi:MAG: 2-succinyl-5-enolpyruvyl-6-hydroxy-3-cyclohexene-1-carboxylic-acid synthase [Actinomycetota bacterium]|nr:2-succinyl-5-enolpyruvyl-6-hydroxy-3-cyclohexene-1-carboxylic-acid synthase [Actinomycetota bacterium]